MYKIVKVSYRHTADLRPIEVFIMTVNCSYEHLIGQIMPKLKKLAESEQLAINLINSDAIIKYKAVIEDSIPADIAVIKLNSMIESNVAKHNEAVKHLNKTIANKNRRDFKPADEGIIAEVDKKYYLNPFLKRIACVRTGNCIIISANTDDLTNDFITNE